MEAQQRVSTQSRHARYRTVTPDRWLGAGYSYYEVAANVQVEAGRDDFQLTMLNKGGYGGMCNPCMHILHLRSCQYICINLRV